MVGRGSGGAARGVAMKHAINLSRYCSMLLGALAIVLQTARVRARAEPNVTELNSSEMK